MKLEIREIDGWNTPEGWIWNTSYHLGILQTESDNIGRTVRYWLKNRGIEFKPHRTVTVFDGSIWEISDRKTQEPLIAAIPIEYAQFN